MKKRTFIPAVLAIVVFVVLVILLRPPSSSKSVPTYTTTVQLSGTAGASFSGEYVRDGKRVTISGVLPWNLTETNITWLEIRKAEAGDTFTVDAHGGGSKLSATAGPDTRGLHLDMEGGWSVETIR